MKNPAKTRRHPILDIPYLGTILLAAWGLVFCAYIITAPAYFLTGSDESIPYYCSAILGSILVMIIHKAWFKGEYQGSFRRGTTLNKSILIPVAVFFVIDLIDSLIGMYRMGFCLISLKMFVTALEAGFLEEVVFRVLAISILMRYLKNKDSYLPALLMPAILFGLMHLTNLSVAPLSVTLLQVVGTFGGGLLFGAIYLRTGNIGLPILVHAVHDIMAFMIATQSTGAVLYEATGIDIVETIIMGLIDAGIAIWILRGHKDDILAIWKERWITPENSKSIAEDE